jgi:perosamine synthetase
MIHLSRPQIGCEEVSAVTRVLASGQLAQGPEVEAFEGEFAAYLRTEGPVHAVATNNGTAALELALLGLGIGPGDEVVLPAFTFIASANAVRAVGATPVFADIEEASFTLDPASARAAVGPRTAALMPVHLYGHPADMVELSALAASHHLAIVEDAAQAHGAADSGRRVGTMGTGCFSFYPTKNMTTGEGGMVTTSDASLADRMRLIRNHGMGRKYEYETFGVNLRMSEVAAAIGRIQLTRLETWNEQRRRNAAWLDEHLVGVATPQLRSGVTHVYHQYTVRTPEREHLAERLRDHGVGFGIYYPRPLHHTAPYAQKLALPCSERVAGEVLSLPVRPDLDAEELDVIACAVGST